jgi:hypothetical protein
VNTRALLLALAVGLAITLPTLRLPWSGADDHATHSIVLQIDKDSTGRLGASLTAPLPFYPGRVQSGLWLWWWAWYRVIGFDLLAHRALRVVTFLLLGSWVFHATRRVTSSIRWALFAAAAFFLFPSHYEVYLALQPAEPLQVLALAGVVEGLLLSGRWLLPAGLLLAFAVSLKETTLAFALPLAVASLWQPPRGRILVWVAFIGSAAIAFIAYTRAIGPPPPGSWASGYHLDAITMLRSARHFAGEFWLAAAFMIPLGLAGELVHASRLTKTELLSGAWAVAALVIYLPWTRLAPRHFLFITTPLVVFCTCGLARLPRSRLLRLILALSAGWLILQSTVTIGRVLGRYWVLDVPRWNAVACLADACPERETITHLVVPGSFSASQSPLIRHHLQGFAKRPDLDIEAGLAATRWNISGPDPISAPAACEPILIIQGTLLETFLPDPYYTVRVLLRGSSPLEVHLIRKVTWGVYRHR